MDFTNSNLSFDARVKGSERHFSNKATVRPFNLSRNIHNPPAIPDFDNVSTQTSQTNIRSSQIFKRNSKLFDGFTNSFYNTSNGDTNGYYWQNGDAALEDDNFLPTLSEFSHRSSEAKQLSDSPLLFSQQSSFEGNTDSYDQLAGGWGHENNRRVEEKSFQRSSIIGTPNPLVIQDASKTVQLRSTQEIPEKYRSVFKNFPYFNIVQSRVFNEVMYTDRPLVVCAPTGSGKTIIFELAIIRLLMTAGKDIGGMKIVYTHQLQNKVIRYELIGAFYYKVAPMKALCSERHDDWNAKFSPLGLKCKEVTGDSELEDYIEIQDTHIVMTTPEKWDSMTRKWRDNRSFVQEVRLFLIDEKLWNQCATMIATTVHMLNDEDRGATVEAVISRMKTVQTAVSRSNDQRFKNSSSMRLIAISATVLNVDDIASWLGRIENPASSYSLDDSYRPVKLRKIVLGYPMHKNMNEFRFDMTMNYKLSGIIHTYSDRKPTLVFCATRKSAQQASATLVKDARFIMDSQHRRRLQEVARTLHDSKLRDIVTSGVGYHHAGLDTTDRKTVESMFLRGDLPVLFATSTLAVGVNLPAHLVIVKSTFCYVKGSFHEYSETQILQMIGRAGRPQFDSSATAIILTTSASKAKYDALLQGTKDVESSLHKHLIEHLNAEIVLNTITDVSIALEWLKSTFLYIRILKNPSFYGIPKGLDKEALEQSLQEMCIKDLNKLENSGLIKLEEGFLVKPKDSGRLMARYCIAYDTMKVFQDIGDSKALVDLVVLISKCKEFSDVQLRTNERRILNTLNKDKNKQTIRFPLNGKIRTTEQKVNCLIQATLGCLTISEFSLNQDVVKIFRVGQRVTRCLTELLMLKTGACYSTLLNAIIISKCLKARLWENSIFVSRQLEKIGTTLSQMLVNAGLTTLKKIEETNPREIEMIVNRHPPFGNQIREAVAALPKYDVSIEQLDRYSSFRADLQITITMTNYLKRKDSLASSRVNHYCVLIAGDSDNKIVFKQRLGDALFLKDGTWSKRVEVRRAVKSAEVVINFISQEYVGIDVTKTFTPYYSGSYFPVEINDYKERKLNNKTLKQRNNGNKGKQSGDEKLHGTPKVKGPCNHRCVKKQTCGHGCCKVVDSSLAPVEANTDQMDVSIPKESSLCKRGSSLDSFLTQLHNRASTIPGTPAVKRLKTFDSIPWVNSSSLVNNTGNNLSAKFGYQPKSRTWNSFPKKSTPELTANTDLSFSSNWNSVDQSVIHQQACDNWIFFDKCELEDSDDEYLYRNCLDSVNLTTAKKQEKSLSSQNGEWNSGKSVSDLFLCNTIKPVQYNNANDQKSKGESHRAQDVLPIIGEKTCAGIPSYFRATSAVRSRQGTEDGDAFMDIFQDFVRIAKGVNRKGYACVLLTKQRACRIKTDNFKEFPVKTGIYGIFEDPLYQVSYPNFKF